MDIQTQKHTHKVEENKKREGEKKIGKKKDIPTYSKKHARTAI